MEHKKKAVIVFIYNSFNDPLFYNLLLATLKDLNQKRIYDFYLITHEQEFYKMSDQEYADCRHYLREKSIYWYPLKWHSGNSLLIKFYDFIKGFFLIVFLKFRFNIKVILSFANISGAFSFIYSRILKMKFIIFSYEPHCEFMADLGIWERKSLKFKISKFLDNWMGMHGDYIITGTRHMVERLKQLGRVKNIYRLPTPVDEDDFKYTAIGRNSIRKKYNIDGKKVFLYMGKFGDLYYKEEIACFCKVMIQYNKDYFFLIVTSSKHEDVDALFTNQGIEKDFYVITGNLSNAEVKDYISASDIGISAVPPTPSQLFRSPTKVGEFLSCGLPYITVKGVSEDDEYALKYNVGIVVNSFKEQDLVEKIKDIELLLSEENSLKIRCREIGIEYRGKGKSQRIFSEIFTEVFTLIAAKKGH
jgi:hypothetical protein